MIIFIRITESVAIWVKGSTSAIVNLLKGSMPSSTAFKSNMIPEAETGVVLPVLGKDPKIFLGILSTTFYVN